MDDGGAVILSVAKYYSPSGKAIQDTGVTPTILVTDTDGSPEGAVYQTRALYAGANRYTATRLSRLDLPEGNAMRAPGEATGMMALEIAIDEMAEKLGIDPVEFRVINDTQVVPDNPPAPPSTDPQSQDKDSITQEYQKESKALLNVSPRNVFNAWQLASLDITNRVQPTPPQITNLLPAGQ